MRKVAICLMANRPCSNPFLHIKIKRNQSYGLIPLNWHAERDKSASRISCSTTAPQCSQYPSSHHSATKQLFKLFYLTLRAPSGFESLFNVKIKREQYLRHYSLLIGTLKGIRTPDPLLRRQMLYPTELSARMGCLSQRKLL